MNKALELEVRAYIRRRIAQFAPFVALAAMVICLLVLVPDTHGSLASDPGALAGENLGSTDQPVGGEPGAAGSGNGKPGKNGTPGTPATGGPTAGSAGPGSGGGNGTPDPGGSGGSGGSSGVSAAGVKCSSGARQFKWAPYAPACTPRYTGTNPGATARGVTATTITMTLRNPSDWDSLASSTNTDTFASLAHDTSVLVDYFNTQYELYGRKVVVKTFDGRGSFVAENAGQGQAAASADAQTAYDMGTFVDGFPFSSGSYADAEASRRIIHFSPGNSLSAYRANSPYRYGMPAGAVNEIQGEGVAAFVCQRMAKLKAIFAGSTVTAAQTRKFAVVEPEQTTFAGGAAVLASRVKSQCGETVKTYKYSTDLTSMPAQAGQIVAQMQADQNTTVIMLTDPIMVQFMTASATNAQYHPEWLYTVLPATLARQADATQMKHAMQLNPWHPTVEAPSGRLCYRIYQLADPNGTPASSAGGLDVVCSTLLAIFGGLQSAGPQLTATNFNRGWFNQPPATSASDFGRWDYNGSYYSPAASFSVSWWNPGVTSAYDRGKGQFQSCAGLLDKPYLNPSLGSGQPGCFGGS